MHDNSAKQSWTLDPSAISALGSPPSVTPFQPSGQAWASEVSKRTQHGARSSLQAHPPSSSPLKGKRCPTGRLYFPKTTLTTLEKNKEPNNQRYPFHEIPDELEENSAKGSTTYQQKRGLILLSQTCGLQGNQWKALEGLDSHPHNRPHHHAYQCHYELPVWKLTNGTFLGFFKSTRSGCAANRPPIQFTLTCLSRKRGPQDSPDDQFWVYCSGLAYALGILAWWKAGCISG